jgi:2-methylaconitate cis-trans-isomerase PrpF
MSPRIALAALALLLAQPLAAQVYQWRDADGKLHFTDTPPPQSREVESPDLQVNSVDAVPTQAAEPAAGAQATALERQGNAGTLLEKGRMQCSTAIARMPTLINETQKLGRDGVRKQKITQDQLDKAMYRMDDFYKGLKRNERECLSEYLASEKSRTAVDCLADTPDVLSFGQCMQFADWAETFR